METRTKFITALFIVASSPLWAQQPPSSPNPQAPPATPQTTPATPQSSPTTPQDSATASPATPAAAMSPINVELVSKLDSKTAKTGDDIVVQTSKTAKTADGTEIPKGSKLMGHVVSAQASQGGTNSQMALKFDRIELKGGQTVPIQSQIQSITPAGSDAPESSAAAMGPAAGSPSMSGRASGTASAGSTNPGMTPNRSAGGAGSSAPQSADPSNPASAQNGPPAAGTVVGRTGQIAIATTSVPGVLLANNAPGEQDPRLAQVSSVLLGAKRDIQLDGGTQMVIGIATVSAGTR